MSLIDPIVVWTAAFVGTILTSDLLPGFALGATIYYLLIYPMGSAPLAAEPLDNWNSVTRPLFFILYGSGTALSCAWLFKTPVLIPSHGTDESTHPMMRKVGLYTLLVSPVTLTANIIWLTGNYAPTVEDTSATISAGPPIWLIYVFVVAFATLSVVSLVLVHRDTLAGSDDSALAITRYGAGPGDRDEGMAIIVHAWLGIGLVAAQALWYAPFQMPWVLALIADGAVLALAYVVVRNVVPKSVTKRRFSKKAGVGVGWGEFVFLLAVVIIGVGGVYTLFVGTVITTVMDVDWLLWTPSILLLISVRLLPTRRQR